MAVPEKSMIKLLNETSFIERSGNEGLSQVQT